MERQNNFDFLRLLFSSLVIFSHSFPLTGEKELLLRITNDQIDLGSLSVNVFFIMSGYLIFNSLKYSKTVNNYIWKRCLRLFPGLLVMLLISLIIIAVVHNGNNIFLQKDFYSYLPNNLFLYTNQYYIAGVFENNIFPKAINGSLLTLSYEFTMYLLILLFFPIRNNKKVTLIILFLFWIIFCLIGNVRPNFFKNIFLIINLDSARFYRLAAFFIAGSILCFFDLKKINNNLTKIGITFILITSVYFNNYNIISNILLPILVITIGLSFSKTLSFLPNKIGDISYGVYIYGFIVQQTLMNYFNFNPYELAFTSFVITYILSYFSWNYIEKKTLVYKNLI